MDPASLLAQLKTVHTPAPLDGWPPAIGWWLLAGLVLSLVIIGAWKIILWRRQTAWRRAALLELRQLQARYATAPDAQTLATISALLKRCAAIAKHNPSILSSTGSAWHEILAAPAGILLSEDLDLLCDGHYRPKCEALDTAAFQRFEQWLKRLAV